MLLRRRALWALAVLLSLMLLIAPALWNGFALLQYDTGGYLAPWFDGRLHTNRSAPYGLLLVAGQWPDFWPVLIVQSALTIWVLALTLRAHGFGKRPLLLLGIVAALCRAHHVALAHRHPAHRHLRRAGRTRALSPAAARRDAEPARTYRPHCRWWHSRQRPIARPWPCCRGSPSSPRFVWLVDRTRIP